MHTIWYTKLSTEKSVKKKINKKLGKYGPINFLLHCPFLEFVLEHSTEIVCCSVFVLQVWWRAGRSVHGSTARRWLRSSEKNFKWGGDFYLHILVFLMHWNYRTSCFHHFFFLLVITDQKKRSLVCASFSSWFWFRTGNSCLVSMKTPVKKTNITGTFGLD